MRNLNVSCLRFASVPHDGTWVFVSFVYLLRFVESGKLMTSDNHARLNATCLAVHTAGRERK